MGVSVCTADETSVQARCLWVHGGSDVLAGLSSSVYTFIGHSAPKGTISVCTRIEDICGLVGVLTDYARFHHEPFSRDAGPCRKLKMLSRTVNIFWDSVFDCESVLY